MLHALISEGVILIGTKFDGNELYRSTLSLRRNLHTGKVLRDCSSVLIPKIKEVTLTDEYTMGLFVDTEGLLDCAPKEMR